MAFEPDSELRADFNAALVQFKVDGAYAALYDKIFGEEEAVEEETEESTES